MHSDDAPHKDRVTASDIARKLGLSQSTVSRVLSGSQGYQFSDETRKRIRAKAEQLGYRPHAVAQSLRQRRTRVIGFCSRYGRLDARNTFQAEIIGSLQRTCSDNAEYLLLYGFAPGTPDERVYGELVSGRVDGLILHASDGDPLVARLAASRLPTVAVADRITGIPSVVCDDRGGMALAVGHLAERGHRRIGFMHATPRIASVRARMEGFRTAMERLGLEPRLVEVPFEDAAPALQALRAEPDPPTALCCWNDVTAMVLLEACAATGLRVPEDLAVMGFDGLLDPRLTGRRLTTVAAHWPEVTRRALEALRARLAGEGLPDETIVDVALRLGKTT